MNNKINKILLGVAIIALVVVVVVFGFYFYKFPDALNNSKTDLGVFGDFVGGTLNPLLSFFGFIALLYTVVIQRKVLESNDKTQAKQQFESTFFSLLNVHNQVLENLFQQEPSSLKMVLREIYPKKNLGLDHCNSALKKQIHLCIHYLKVLYELLRFIKTNSLGDDERNYSNIVRALLPFEIMTLLAIYCYDEKNGEFKLLIERYAIFEDAIFKLESYSDGSLDASEIKKFYDDKAFGLQN